MMAKPITSILGLLLAILTCCSTSFGGSDLQCLYDQLTTKYRRSPIARKILRQLPGNIRQSDGRDVAITKAFQRINSIRDRDTFTHFAEGFIAKIAISPLELQMIADASVRYSLTPPHQTRIQKAIQKRWGRTQAMRETSEWQTADHIAHESPWGDSQEPLPNPAVLSPGAQLMVLAIHQNWEKGLDSPVRRIIQWQPLKKLSGEDFTQATLHFIGRKTFSLNDVSELQWVSGFQTLSANQIARLDYATRQKLKSPSHLLAVFRGATQFATRRGGVLGATIISPVLYTVGLPTNYSAYRSTLINNGWGNQSSIGEVARRIQYQTRKNQLEESHLAIPEQVANPLLINNGE